MCDDHVPDRAEKGIRFGCGFLAGAVFGGLWAVNLAADDLAVVLLLAGSLALVFAVLAVRHGDRFWHALGRWLWWWRWRWW